MFGGMPDRNNTALSRTAPGSPSRPPEQMDMGDLELKVAEIIAAYQRPAIQAKVNASLDVLRDAMNRPEVKKMFAALDKAKP